MHEAGTLIHLYADNERGAAEFKRLIWVVAGYEAHTFQELVCYSHSGIRPTYGVHF